MDNLLDNKPKNGNLDEGRGKAISEILEDIIKEQEKLSTFAVYGDWGTGKTSVCNTVFNKLKLDISNNSDYKRKKKSLYLIPIWFESWRFQHEYNIYPALLRTIAKELTNLSDDYNVKESSKKLLKYSKAILKSVFSGLTISTPSLGGFGVNLSGKDAIDNFSIEDDYDINHIDNSAYFKAFEILQHIVSYTKINEKPIKIVIFIDDLDRCLPEVAFRMIEDIKVWFDIDNIITCLALNKKEIIRVVAKYYKTHLDLNENEALTLAGDYFYKIVPFGIYVDKYPSIRLTKEFMDSFNDTGDKKDLLSPAIIFEKNKEKIKNDKISLRKYISIINEYYIEKLIFEKLEKEKEKKIK